MAAASAAAISGASFAAGLSRPFDPVPCPYVALSLT